MAKKMTWRVCGVLVCGAMLLAISTVRLSMRTVAQPAGGLPIQPQQERTLRLCIRCEALPDGTVLTAVGTRQSASATVSGGEAVLSLLPGRYRIGNAVFTLSEQARPTALSGPCRDDGELLYLTGAVLGSVTVQLSRVPDETVFVYLAGEDDLRCLGVDESGQCVFYDLPLGSYRVYTAPDAAQRVSLSLQQTDVTVKLTI